MENLVGFGDLHSVFRDKKVLITGHTGFKGSWLTAVMHLLGASVKGYALPPEYDDSLFSFLRPLQIIDSVFGDLREKQKLMKEIHGFQPDFIFHLAAQPLVRTSYQLPAETFEVNAVGTANLLEALISLPNKCTTLVITTDKVYENKEQHIFYQESDRLGGFDPYSASKACTEIVTASFRHSFFNTDRFLQHQKAITTARAGNVIGGGDWSKDRIMPDIVRSLRAGKAIEVRNPTSVRPWQHVLEPLFGYMVLAARLNDEPVRYAAPYNFGPLPSDHLEVRSLVEIAINAWGGGNWNDCSDPAQPHEAGLLQLDISKAQKELFWTPKLSAEQAITWTVNWYKQKREDVVAFTFDQINKFVAL
jgi:CDP-glucose 4,6-dehydratase